MNSLKKTVIPVFLATIWISLSEFIRNEFLFKSYWVEHYEQLGLTFPSASINGVVWGLWSMLFAAFIFIISKKFRLWSTIFISWFGGFVLMWLVTANLNVLPFQILSFALPLSLFEVVVATLIIKKLSFKG